jgi:hypothetical protein
METSTNLTAVVASKPQGSPRKRVSRLTLPLTLTLTLTLALTLCSATLVAQQNPLNREVTIAIDHKRLDDALDRVSKKGQFAYSYRTDLLRADSLVSIDAQEEQVRKITEQLLGPGYDLKAVGNHVVIRKAHEPPLAEAPAIRRIEGFLIDAKTGEKIRFATVYDNASRQNTLSDPQGHYALDLPGHLHQAELNISRRGYFDTLIVVNPSRVAQLTVGLRPYPYANQPVASREPDLLEGELHDQLPLADWLVGQEQLQLVDNLDGPLHQFPVQISLLPRIGTNRLLSGAMENNFSLNILAGYANGVNGFEVGGLVNLDRQNVRGFQVAGLVNVVGGNVSGFQVAGLVNHVRGTVTGLQVGGILNYTPHPVKGMQVAGIANYSPGDVSHVQIGGLVNYARGNVGGFQIGGLVDYARGNVGGFQIGGLTNYSAGEVNGFQIGGLVNYAGGNVGGFQIGGITNYARGNVGRFQVGGIANVAKGNVNGFQIGGIVNKAQVVNGFQIGLVNVADSVGGFCIGALNLIKKGYKVVEFSSNDVTQANLSYKAGRSQFYNILSVGYRFGPEHFAVSYGGGLGTLQPLGPLTLSLEVTCNDVIEQGLGPGRMNMLLPVRMGLGLPIGSHLEIFAGAAHNLHITKPQNSLGEFNSALGQNPIWRHDGRNTRVQGWVGYQGGIRVIL